MTAPDAGQHNARNSKRRSLFSSLRKSVNPNNLQVEVKEMVEAISDEEKEIAARASYKYLWQSVTAKEQCKELLDARDFFAGQMAMRHLHSKKGNFKVAMEKFRSAIQFRKEADLDGLRLCFQAHLLDLDDETKERYRIYREKLEDRMTAGRVYPCGHDKHGRAIYTIFAARTRDFDPEWFLKESLYNFERAIACTEKESKGTEQCITVIGNYTGFTKQHAAPMSISHEFMNCLRQNYPGRVKDVYLLNTPTSFHFFWAILKPFIGTDTRKKIHFVGEKQKKDIFSDMVSIDQAAPWMIAGGHKTKEFDAKEYLHDTPFDQPFDP